MGDGGEPSWRSYLIRIGDRCSEYDQDSVEEHVKTCTVAITRDIRRKTDDMLDVLMECIEEIPHKHPYYAVVVGLINVDEASFVTLLLERIHRRFQNALDVDEYNRIRILLRFIATLMCSNVLSTTALVEVFEMLLSSAATTVDEEVGNPAWQPRADFYVFCILATLPWCAAELQERSPEELERVMAAVEAYFSLRTSRSESSLSPFNVETDGDEVMADQDHMQDIWSKVQQLQQAGWKTECVPRPYGYFEARLASQTNHQIGSFTCPSIPSPEASENSVEFGKQRQEADIKYPQRTGRLRVFPTEKFEKDMTPMDRFIIEEYLLDILTYFNGSRKECATYMVTLPVPFQYDHAMAEVVFGQMLLLPRPPFKLVYYSIVIIDLCKALPKVFPPILAATVRILFDRMGEMDVECQTRLTQWLSHHMSNFQFTWPWEDWVHVAEQPIWSPQRVFVQELLDKAIRLSYWERVKQSIEGTAKLCELLPLKSDPEFKFSKEKNGDETQVGFSSELMAQMKTKKALKDAQVWFETKVVPTVGPKLAVEILVQTLVHMGTKSFTHMVTNLERYGQLVVKLASELPLQVCVVEEIANFWQNSSQMISIVIDRMMTYRLISNLAVVKWAFSESSMQTFHTSGRVWELLQNVISKTSNRTTDLQKDVVNARKAMDEANAAAAKADNNRANVQKSIDAATSEDSRRQLNSKMEWVKTTITKAKGRQTAAEDQLETKEALLARALREQESVFFAVFQSFASAITDKISKSDNAVDAGESAMEVDVDPSANEGDPDADNERRNERFRSNEEKRDLKDEEFKQWMRCTVGHLQAISRQYATEVWRIVERLDAEVFTEGVSPVVVRAVYTGIGRPM